MAINGATPLYPSWCSYPAILHMLLLSCLFILLLKQKKLQRRNSIFNDILLYSCSAAHNIRKVSRGGGNCELLKCQTPSVPHFWELQSLLQPFNPSAYTVSAPAWFMSYIFRSLSWNETWYRKWMSHLGPSQGLRRRFIQTTLAAPPHCYSLRLCQHFHAKPLLLEGVLPST